MTTRLHYSDLPPAILADPRNRKALALASKPPQSPASAVAPVKQGQNRASKPRGPNKTEARFNREVLFGAGQYEAITFRLPGGSRYTPDWTLDEPDGRIGCYEVKGFYRFPSEGRALTAFRECRAFCAQHFPVFRFRWFRRSRNGWEECHLDR